jgi:hypothetical protein
MFQQVNTLVLFLNVFSMLELFAYLSYLGDLDLFANIVMLK